MTQFLTLVRKDFKASWKIYGMLITILCVLVFIMWFFAALHSAPPSTNSYTHHDIWESYYNQHVNYRLLVIGTNGILGLVGIIFPFLFLLIREERSNSIHLTMNLPIPPSLGFLSKLVCAGIMGMVFYFIFTIISILGVGVARYGIGHLYDYFSSSITDILFAAYLFSQQSMHLLLIAITAWTASRMVRRYRYASAFGGMAIALIIFIPERAVIKQLRFMFDILVINRSVPWQLFILSEIAYITAAAITVITLSLYFLDRRWEI